MGIFVRVWGLWDHYYYADEVLILGIANGETLSEVYARSLPQAHPPLYYFFLHLILKISSNIFFLKSSSMIASILLIIVFSRIGKEIGGNISGIAMAAFAAFGYGAVILSEIVRQYSIFVLFLSVALLFFLFHIRKGKWKHAYLYIFFMMLAHSFHYSAVFPLAATGLIWLFSFLARKKPFSDYVRLVLLHVPLLLLSLTFYYFHLSRISGSFQKWKGIYLDIGFAKNAHELLYNVYTLFNYFFNQSMAPVFAALTLIGFYSLYKTKHFEILGIAVLCLIMNIVFSLMHLYPLFGMRQTFFLFPYMAVLSGSSFNFIYEAAKEKLQHLVPSNFNIEKTSILAAPLFILLTIGVCCQSSKSDFFRAYQNSVIYEFTLTNKDYKDAFKYLEANKRPGDLVICTRQAGDYLVYESGQKKPKLISDVTAVIEHKGIKYYFHKDNWVYETKEELRYFIKEVSNIEKIENKSNVWIINIGFGNIYMYNTAVSLFSQYTQKIQMVENGSVLIMAVPGKTIIQMLNE